MLRFDPFRTMPLLALAGMLALAGRSDAQERSVVANQVEVSRDDASLHLEFSDGERFDVSFEEGTVRVDGNVLGEYQVGGDADQAWRGLLADILSLSNGALARELARWQPDPGSEATELELLQALDEVLEDAVAEAANVRRRSDEEALEVQEGLSGLLRLLARSDYSEGLGEALEDVDLDRIQVWFDEDHTIQRDEVVDGTVLLVEGELDVRGRVRGDVIVIGGQLSLDGDATVDGDIRLIDSSLSESNGEVRGSVVDVTRELRESRSRIREEIRDEIRNELRRSTRVRYERSDGFVSRTARAVGGVFEAVLTFVLIGILALGVSRFGGERVDRVVRAVGNNPARSAAVGFAGSFLVVPVYILGLLVLTVSIVGIPALLIWGPLFPLAVALGGFVGYVSVSQFVGRWVLSHGFPWLDWVNEDSDNHVRLVGLAALLVPFAAASVLQIVPIVGWLGGIVSALGTLACLVALIMGFGAVIITRGGRLSGYDFDMSADTGDWASDFDDSSFDTGATGSEDDGGV